MAESITKAITDTGIKYIIDAPDIWTNFPKAAAVFLFLSAILLAAKWFIERIEREAKKTDNTVDDFVLYLSGKWLEPWVVASLALWVATAIYPLTKFVDVAAKTTFLLVVTYRGIRTTEISSGFLIKTYLAKNKSQETLNMLTNFNKVVRVLLWSGGIVFALDNCGFNISAVIAGFGIGGLAVALAAQQMLADGFAAFVLFMDKPFEVGHAVTLNGHTGTITKIGLRSTELRRNTGELVVFPNSTILNATLMNYSTSTNLNGVITIGIAVETPFDKVREVPDILKAAANSVENAEGCEAYFNEFAESSFNFNLHYSATTSSPSERRRILGEINTAINEKMTNAGISMPYPCEIRLTKDMVA